MNSRILLLVFLLFFTSIISAQRNNNMVIHEIGAFIGPSALYSDFGERNDFETNSNNVGIGFGIFYVLNFVESNNFGFFTEHFRIRTDLTYNKTNLKFYGRYVDPNKNSLLANQLRATEGSVRIIEFGPQLEYYFLNIRDYMYGVQDFAPYVSLGMHYVNFDPEIINTNPSLPPLNTNQKYIGSYQQEVGHTAAVVGGFGLRYSLDRKSDIIINSRWTFFFSDYVDGLNPTFENNGGRPVPENNANDWTYSVNFGYIYYIN